MLRIVNDWLKIAVRIVCNLKILTGVYPSYYVSRVEFRNDLLLGHYPLCINVIIVWHAPVLKYIPFS